MVKKKVDVTETLAMRFSGSNGYGTAEIEDLYSWEKEALEAANIKEIDSFSDLGDAFIIESAVSYDISPKENLSNGDEVTVTVKIDNEAIEKYDIQFVGEEKKFIVEGLSEIQTIDLFENVDVLFQGTAPYATAMVSDANTDYYVETHYTLDKNQNLNSDDIVTVTAKYDKDKLLQAGYMAESDTKEYVVSNVSRYITDLVDIPDDAMEKLEKQTEDIIKSNIARYNGYSLENLNFLGNYFLNSKDYESNWGEKNITYFVYEVDLTGKEDLTYYYCAGYYDILLTEEDECVYDFSNIKMPSKSIYKGLTIIDGYPSIDEMFNDCVTKHLDKYEYESTVPEVIE